jgi:PAS domain S-box-containing protein
LKDHAIATAISGMGIADLEGRIIYANEALCKMWGCTDKSILQGKEVSDAFESNTLTTTIEKIIESGIEYGEAMGKRIDGSLFPVAFSGNAVRDKRGNPICMFGSFIDISEQKKAHYLSDTIIDSLPGIFFMFDVEEKMITRWNKALEGVLNYSTQEIIDMDFLSFVTEPDRTKAEQKIEEAILHGTGESEITLITKQGIHKPFYFSGFNVTIEKKLYLIVNGVDISARKSAEEQLKKKYEQLQLLANLSDAVSKASQLEDIYELALDGLLTSINADKSSILQFDAEGILQFRASHGLSDAYKIVAASHSPWKADAKNPVPIYISDAEKDESLQELLPVILNEGIRALGFIPMVYMGRLLGKFMVYYNEVHDFTEEESQLAQTIARDVAFAIGEKENELALRKSEQRYRDVVNNTNEIIFQTDATGAWTFLNPAWTTLLGYSIDESIGKQFQNFVFPEDVPESQKKLEELITRQYEYCRHELRYVTKMNTICWMEVTARLLLDNNGTVLGTTGIINDITDSKKAREQILKEKKLSDSIINTLPGIFYIYDDQGKFYRWNKNLEIISGYSTEEISKMVPMEFFDTDEKEYMMERSRATFIFGKSDAESYLFTKSKQKIRYYFNCIAISYEGKICSMEMGIDITERKKAEAALELTTLQLRELSAHLQDVREEERATMAREIHDELGQQLTVLKFDFSWLQSKLEVANPSVEEKIIEIKSLLDKAVKTVRRLSTELRPSLLDDLGLIDTIDWYLNDFKKRFNIKTEFRHFSDQLIVPDKIKTALFRIFQESITNIIRHADPSLVKVVLNKAGDNVILQIKDNGKGFDMLDVSNKKTLGLLGMKERTLLMGGDCLIESIAGEGTTVTVSVPLSSIAAAI